VIGKLREIEVLFYLIEDAVGEEDAGQKLTRARRLLNNN
jgi:hypothetical protein